MRLAGVEELLSRIKRPQAPNYALARVSIERMLGQKSHTPPDLLMPKAAAVTEGLRVYTGYSTRYRQWDDSNPLALAPKGARVEQHGRRGLLRLGGT